MPSHLEYQHLLRLRVNGSEIPINLSSFIELSINQNIAISLPTFKFVYRDPGNYLHDGARLHDGALVGIVMHSAVFSDPEPPNEMVFRVTGTKCVPDGNTLRWTAVGVLNHVNYMRGIAYMPEKGTSAQAIANLAGSVGLKPIVDATSDNMIWRPAKDFIRNFIGNISRHGYAGDGSIMSHGVNDQSELIYKDVAKLATSGGGRDVRALSDNKLRTEHGDVPYLTWEAKSVGGFNNYYYGYGVKIVQELLTGQANLIDKMTATLFGSALNLSSELMEGLGGVRNEYVPADMTNCQTGDTLIPTEKGIIPIKDLAGITYKVPKDFSKDLQIKVVGRNKPEYTSKWIYSGKAPTLNITTEHGNELNCTANHPNLVFNNQTGNLDWIKSKNCKIDDLLCITPNQIVRNNSLHLNLIKNYSGLNTVEVPKLMTPDLAALLGYIISEGYYTRRYICFYNTNLTLIKDFIEKLETVFGLKTSYFKFRKATNRKIIIAGNVSKKQKTIYGVRIGSIEACDYLKQMGIYNQTGLRNGKRSSHFKEIPWSILQADKYSQLAFLAAYLEGDGTIDNKTGRISWYSSSKKLLMQMQVILNSHGFAPRMRTLKTCKGLYLNRKQSSKLWQFLKEFMIHKELLLFNDFDIDMEGVPSDYWINLIRSRRVYPIGKRRNEGVFYVDDEGKEVQFTWKVQDSQQQAIINQILRTSNKFYYHHYEKGLLDEFLKRLNLISKKACKQLVELLMLKYVFTRITKIRKGPVRKVYDICMRKDTEHAFVANGLIVHNTHPKYFEAENQNKRGAALFSNIVFFLTHQATGLSIYDVVHFFPTLPTNNEISEMFAGRYIVTAKTRYIGQTMYLEKIEISNQGFGGQPGIKLPGF